MQNQKEYKRLEDFYPPEILAHYRSPQNFGRKGEYDYFKLQTPNTCGVKHDLFLLVKGDVLEEIAFEGDGMLISKVSCSIMTSITKGMNVNDITSLVKRFISVTEGELPVFDLDKKLSILIPYCKDQTYKPWVLACWKTILSFTEESVAGT